MEKRSFAELGLSAEVLKAVDKMGFEEASPIQTAVIPVILEGRDVIGQSSTGSGKTAAFAIPAIEKIDVSIRAVQVLVLCPTRELAVQVAEEAAKLALFKRGFHAVPIYGGQSYERQFRALELGAHMVIGTPGRVIDHIERGTLKLDKLKMLTLDEADRMLDMGFREDIERVLTAVPEQRQLLFFSATMPPAIQYLIKRFTRDPAWIRIEAHAQNAPKVEQVYFEVERRSKLEVLTRVIDLHDFRYGIIFCSTKIMVDDLDEVMHARGYAVDRLHGDITQAQRDRVMEKFRRRGFEFLIATDVAARGLDVDDLEVVFNFDLPNDAEDYTHRIGRTGRAGKEGRAFTFVSGREIYKLQGMVRFAKLKIRRENVPSLDQVEEARENVFFEKLRTTLNEGAFKKQDRTLDRLLEQGYTSTDIAAALIHLLQQAPGASAPAGAAPAAPSAPAAAGASKTVGQFKSVTPVSAAAKAAAPAKSAATVKSAEPVVKAHAPVRKETPAAKEPAHRATAASPAAAPAAAAPAAPEPASPDLEVEPETATTRRQKHDRPGRTGRDPNFTTLFFNVGRKHLILPGDLVGKIAGVTRLPSSVVGAIDIHQRHSLVDVESDSAELVLAKLAGIRLKGELLAPALGTDKDRGD